MGKPPQVPWGYQCPYREACPHLEGMSTHWMWARHQEDIWEKHDLRLKIEGLLAACREQERTLCQQAKQIAEWKAQVQALHRQQFKGKGPSPSAAGRQDSGPGKEKKKRGAPKGHPPWTRRPPGQVDRKVQVAAPDKCLHCGCAHLLPLKERFEHLQEDIVLCPRPEVTCFDHQQAWCPVCERPVMRAAQGELVGASIGPVAKSAAVYLHLSIGLSVRNVQKIMTQMFGLSMVPASVLGFEKAVCRRGQSLYEDLHQKILASAYLHADETSWRVNGQPWWLWYAGHQDLAYFHADPHRSRQAAQALLGRFEGVLNTDDYASYNGVTAKARQSCLAHPLRAAREALEKVQILKGASVEVDQWSQRFIGQAKAFLTEACQLGRKLRQAPLPVKKARALKARWLGRLQRMCARELSWEPAEQLRNRLKKQGKNLLTFIHHPEVEPTNNQAEQSLRRSVIMRKITFGNRSEAGAQRQALLSSLLLTAQRQGRDPRAALESLWTDPIAVAQRAFYRRTPFCKRIRRKQKNVSGRGPSGRDPPQTG